MNCIAHAQFLRAAVTTCIEFFTSWLLITSSCIAHTRIPILGELYRGAFFSWTFSSTTPPCLCQFTKLKMSRAFILYLQCRVTVSKTMASLHMLTMNHLYLGTVLKRFTESLEKLRKTYIWIWMLHHSILFSLMDYILRWHTPCVYYILAHEIASWLVCYHAIIPGIPHYLLPCTCALEIRKMLAIWWRKRRKENKEEKSAAWQDLNSCCLLYNQPYRKSATWYTGSWHYVTIPNYLPLVENILLNREYFTRPLAEWNILSWAKYSLPRVDNSIKQPVLTIHTSPHALKM